MNKQIKKYLITRAITEPWTIKGNQRDDFAAVIVIPVLAERDTLSATLQKICLNPCNDLAQTLVLIVVNNRVNPAADQMTDNQKTLHWLQSNPYPQLNLGWVDASSSGLELPDRDGVGLARKIGFDLSLQRLDWKVDPLLISLDADTLTDSQYLSTIFAYFMTNKKGGAVIPFRHQSGSSQQQEFAIRHYELYLRSYLFGLQLAGSPYAYHSIGSAFACLAKDYIKAGGMNRRCGGEDFYFLQQLKKTSAVGMVHGTVVHPSPRFSDRVPFGTGKAVQEQVETGKDLFHFVPACGFRILQQWLRLVSCQLDRSAVQIIQQALLISPALHKFLMELNFISIWEKLQNNHSSSAQRQKAFDNWFDALRTRQLLVRIEESSETSPQQNIEQLMSWGGYAGLKKETEQLKVLEQLQGVDHEEKGRGQGDMSLDTDEKPINDFLCVLHSSFCLNRQKEL
ncbi:MAG: glycosyltransferase family A protein [Desulfuromusa sp.]|nr:glycosyltransferase family A protein [Desulfuromusa sp.]